MVTARIAGETGGDLPYSWEITYDDQTRRVTAQASAAAGVASITVLVTLTASIGTQKVQFVRAGQPADTDATFPVTIGAAGTVIGPSINANQVSRIVGKPGATGGLRFEETWARV